MLVINVVDLHCQLSQHPLTLGQAEARQQPGLHVLDQLIKSNKLAIEEHLDMKREGGQDTFSDHHLVTGTRHI